MSVYSKATLGYEGNLITFNDYENFPIYRSQTRSPAQFQIRNDDIPVPFESGTNDFKTLIGQTIYVIKGVMYPKDDASYYTGIAALRTVCSLDKQQNDDIGEDSGYVPYTWEESSDSKTIFVKALYVQITEDTRQGYVQPFTIYLKIKDPIIYGNEVKVASTQTSDPTSTTGAAVYPMEYPVVIGSTLYDVNSTAINNGNIPCYPVSIDIYGPINKPRISNSANGESLTVDVNLTNANDLLHIAYNNYKLEVTLNGINFIHKVSGTYFKVEPGTNIITLSGSSIGGGAYATLTYRDSYALA